MPRLSPEDERFVADYDASAFPRPSLTVDVVVMTATDGRLHVVLVRRQAPPFRGAWALPGGFVRIDESLDAAARRVLTAKTGLGDEPWLEQLYTFGDPGRDPRGRVVSVAYFALVPPERLASRAEGTWLAPLHVPWRGETGGAVEVVGADGPLAFDHADLLGVAVLRLRGKLGWTHVGFALLPERFTLRRLQQLHETILGRALNKDSFRRRMLATDLLVATGETEGDVGHRPAALYRFHPGGSDDGRGL